MLLRGDELTDAALAEERASRALGDRRGERRRVAYDLRYRGQAYELTVRGVRPGPTTLREAFAAPHEERYGYRDADGEVELVTVRVAGVEPGPDVDAGGRRRATSRGERSPAPATAALPASWPPASWPGTWLAPARADADRCARRGARRA